MNSGSPISVSICFSRMLMAACVQASWSAARDSVPLS